MEEVGMKKTLGVVALAVIVAASSAFGEPSKVKYIVQLSGDNHVGNNGGGLTPMAYTDGTESPVDFPEGTQVINWAVRVEASGDYNEYPVIGVANAVFDVQLMKDGAPVAIGAGSSSVPGFFSSISEAGELNDTPYPGLGPWPTLAAFTWTYTGVVNAGTTDPGRIFDLPDAGGPHLAQRTYPTAAGYCLPPSGTGPCSTADMSLLVGMGAGYTQFSPEFDFGVGLSTQTERAGVGVSGALNSGGCTGLGTGPIAEGQINVTGLPGGEYTLMVIAGEGNNVLRDDVFTGAGCSTGWGDVNFAVKADSVENGSITFTLVSTGCTEAPVMMSAVSRRTHGPAGDFDIPLNLSGTATVEGRQNGPQMVVVSYDIPIAGTPAVALSAGTLGDVTMDGNELTINMSGVPDMTCLDIAINGIACGEGGAEAPEHHVLVTARFADTNNSGTVNSTDVALIRAKSSPDQVDASTFLYDLNANGFVNSTDVALVRSQSSPAVTTCTY
jgi:hypothetical protein